MEPATKQDVIDATKDLKIFLAERESIWIKWVMGVQITYFVVTLAAVAIMVISHG